MKTGMNIGKGWKMTKMDYKKLADDLLSYCHLNCSACEYAGDALECTIKQLASTAITELLARAEAAEERCKELEERCKRLDEARERANEAAAKWEGMHRIALEQAERAQNGRNKGNVMVCPVCNGSGKVHTGFYGLGSCSMADVMNDKFQPVCRTCKGRGIIEVNEF